MAIFRLEAKIIGRAQGRSAVAGAAYRSGRSIISIAAYRSGEKMHDQGRDLTFDYSRKENVEYSAIMAPSDSPSWVYDRGKLWNAVEQREDASQRPYHAQLAREVLVTLPRELTAAQCIALVRGFVHERYVSKGMIADINIHRPSASDGLAQPHAHILLTLRRLEKGRFTSKAREWNWKVKEWRPSWEKAVNAALAEAGFEERVDHRSNAARGIDREPQPKLGVTKHVRRQRGHHATRVLNYHSVNMRNHMRGQVVDMQPEYLTGEVGYSDGSVVEPARRKRMGQDQGFEP